MKRMITGFAIVLVIVGCDPRTHSGERDVVADETDAVADVDNARNSDIGARQGGGGDSSTGSDQNSYARTIANLPMPTGASDCVAEPAPLAACDWVGSADGVLIGAIVGLRGFDTPMVNGIDGNQVTNCASGLIGRGLEIDLLVDDSTLSGVEGTTVSVRIGPQVSGSWVPAPRYRDDGEIDLWTGDGKGLVVGNLLGVAGFEVADGVFSPGRFPLFTFGPQSGLSAQDAEYCATLFPAELRGQTYAEVVSVMKGCEPREPTSELASERDFLLAHPTYADSAICYQR